VVRPVKADSAARPTQVGGLCGGNSNYQLAASAQVLDVNTGNPSGDQIQLFYNSTTRCAYTKFLNRSNQCGNTINGGKVNCFAVLVQLNGGESDVIPGCGPVASGTLGCVSNVVSDANIQTAGSADRTWGLAHWKGKTRFLLSLSWPGPPARRSDPSATPRPPGVGHHAALHGPPTAGASVEAAEHVVDAPVGLVVARGVGVGVGPREARAAVARQPPGVLEVGAGTVERYQAGEVADGAGVGLGVEVAGHHRAHRGVGVAALGDVVHHARTWRSAGRRCAAARRGGC
jgi:hypothetical protein